MMHDVEAFRPLQSQHQIATSYFVVLAVVICCCCCCCYACVVVFAAALVAAFVVVLHFDAPPSVAAFVPQLAQFCGLLLQWCLLLCWSHVMFRGRRNVCHLSTLLNLLPGTIRGL